MATSTKPAMKFITDPAARMMSFRQGDLLEKERGLSFSSSSPSMAQ